ncbi:hypothetical protein LL974_22700, partial [Xanthomonas campestris pv. cannae]|nr:hypothetical protein [Xanthomonas campestris pv. cannae]
MLEVLEGIRSDPLDATVTVGVLPRDYGFDEVTEALQDIPGPFYSGSNRVNREIRFVPEDAFVYDSLADMLRRRTSALGQVPAKFALRDSDYKHGVTLDPPISVKRYFEAVDLWKALREVASYKTGEQTFHFVAGHDKEACISLKYDADDLMLMP